MLKSQDRLREKLSTSNFGNPMPFSGRTPTPTHLKNYIAPIQFSRYAHDVQMWRDCITEMENPIYPFRTKTQRMYMDTVINPYILALLDRCREVSLQRDLYVYQIKDGKKVISEELSENLEHQDWFKTYMNYVLEAYWYGYSLISLGDFEDGGFPNISCIQRENVRTDTMNEGVILNALVYNLGGIRVDTDDIVGLCNHYIPTKSSRGVSNCGYGLLYPISYNEIHIRHIVEWNVDNIEMYGMPIRKGSTNKTGDERKKFEMFLKNAASNAYILLDKSTQDDVEFVKSDGGGTGWKSYQDLERRLKGVCSQLVLGHEDAMSSSAGKLGGHQSANKDGFNESLIQQAINSKQITYGNFICNSINHTFAPKMRKLGSVVGSKFMKNLIPDGYFFGLQNDKEEEEVKRRVNSFRNNVSTWVGTLNSAGWDVDKEQLSQILDLKLTASIPERKLIEEKKTETNIFKSEDDATKINTNG